jgi:hypothetical protein
MIFLNKTYSKQNNNVVLSVCYSSSVCSAFLKILRLNAEDGSSVLSVADVGKGAKETSCGRVVGRCCSGGVDGSCDPGVAVGGKDQFAALPRTAVLHLMVSKFQ